MSDFIATFKADPDKDHVAHGVKGQRWGIRRSSSALAAAAKTRPGAPAKKESTEGKPAASSGGSVKKSSGNIQDHVESSSDRYDRLTGQAKSGRAHEMTEADLKFYNARTDALAKINKMNEEKPSWLKETTTKVVQQAAQRQMQGISDALADKYIGDPIKNALKGNSDTPDAPSTTLTAAKKVLSEATKPESSTSVNVPAATATKKLSATDKVANSLASYKRAKGDKQYEETKKQIADIEAKKTSNPALMTVSESVNHYRKNPTDNPTPPSGLSPNAYRLWLEQIKKS